MPPNKGVPVELDRTRKLRYKMRAVEKIEEKTGRNVYAQDFFQGITATEFVTVVWAGLIHEDRDVSRDVVLDNMEYADTGDMIEKVQEALGLDQVQEDAEAEDPKSEPKERPA